MPRKPEAKHDIRLIRNIKVLYHGKKAYDFKLQPFAYTCGQCITCGRKSIKNKGQNVNLYPKMVHTSSKPRLIQGIVLECELCGSKFQSFHYDYMITLKPHLRQELNAMIVGGGEGVEMSLVRSMKIGTKMADIEKSSRANLFSEYCVWRDDFEARCKKKIEDGFDAECDPFPDIPEKWVVNVTQLNRAKIKDYMIEQKWLKHELVALQSEHALAVDHQLKAVKSMKTGEGEVNGQSFYVVGDGSFIMSYVVVPDTGMEWAADALKEAVERHSEDSRPRFVYVDIDCCNGHENGRTEKTMHLGGLIKKLDCMHAQLRISSEIPAEHPRKGTFMKKVTKAIFVENTEDVAELEAVRSRHPAKCGKLSAKQKKVDRKHIWRIIPKGKEVVKELILLLKIEATKDVAAKQRWEAVTGQRVP